MAELLGVVAAAVQLAAYSSSLLKALSTIRYASCTLSRYKSQLRSLESICSSIQGNSLLRTREIEAQVKSIVSFIADYIDKKLGKSRLLYWARYLLLRREFADFFKTLEGKKSLLVLSITNATASAIYDIRSNVQILRGTNAMDSSKRIETLKSNSTKNSDNQQNPSQNDSGSPAATCGQQSEKQLTHPSAALRNTEKTVYTGQEHKGHGMQLNGVQVNETTHVPLTEIMRNLEWHKNVKKASTGDQGRGGVAEATEAAEAAEEVQLNGPNFVASASAQAYAGLWEGNIMEADGKQINGPKIGGSKHGP